MIEKVQSTPGSERFILRPKSSYIFLIIVESLIFTYLLADWLVSGYSYSGIMKIVTVFIGIVTVYAFILRIVISPSSILIEGGKMTIQKYTGRIITYDLAELSQVDYSLWLSFLISRSGWIRIRSNQVSIYLSDLFFDNLGDFLDNLEVQVHGISIDRRLAKTQRTTVRI